MGGADVLQVTAVDLGRPGETLKHAFELINLYRLQSKIDTFGAGRNPAFNEPTAVVVLTDGGGSVTAEGLSTTISVPLGTKPGAELVKEPFRWDQRVFAVTLCPSPPASGGGGAAAAAAVPESPFAAMCEVTGGKAFLATTAKEVRSYASL